jgi:hypothetical protein
MGHFFVGCLRELKSTTFCIIDSGSCPHLKRLEGITKIFMYTFFINFSVLIFFVFNCAKELRTAIREDLHTHDFVKRGVRIHHNEVQKIGFLAWPDEMCPHELQL